MNLEVNAVIFDWGNTLCLNPFYRTLELKMNEFLKILNDKEYPIDKEKLIDSWSKADKDIIFPHASHFFQEEKIIRQCLKNMGVKPEHIRTMWKEFMDVYRNGLKHVMSSDPHVQEVKSTLEFLKSKGKKLGIFSNERMGNVETWLEWVGIPKEWFVYVLSSEDVDISKPDLRVFGLIADRIEEPVTKCVYVGDNPVKDINPALGYGMKAILYRVPDEFKKTSSENDYSQVSTPDVMIYNITLLKDIII